MHFFNACSNQKATNLAKRAKKSAAKPSDLVIPLYPAIPAYPFLKRSFVLNNEKCPVELKHNVDRYQEFLYQNVSEVDDHKSVIGIGKLDRYREVRPKCCR